MKVRLSQYMYKIKARARVTGKLVEDLLVSSQDLSVSEIVQELLYYKVIIPANLSTNFYDADSYNSLTDTVNDLTLSKQELDDINEQINQHSPYQYKNINFTKALLKWIEPDKPFVINHHFCWTSQSMFIVNTSNPESIKKAKEIQ